MKTLIKFIFSVILLSFLQQSAKAQLEAFESDLVGQYEITAGARGSNEETYTITLHKPVGATTAYKIYLYNAGSNSVEPPSTITVDGVNYNFPPSAKKSGTNEGFMGYSGEVSGALKTKLDAAVSGSDINLTINEGSSSNERLFTDGVGVIVIWNNPIKSVGVHFVYIGMQQITTAGTQINIPLANPIDKSILGFEPVLGIGISFSREDDNTQRSKITINGKTLTETAGGSNDGSSQSGELITLGGYGDTPDPNDDDELYNISHLLDGGEEQLNFVFSDVDNRNDDYVNVIYFSGVGVGAPPEPVYPNDFGDAPESYEKNNSNATVAARHEISPDLFIGEIADGEAGPQSVAPGADNNGTNGDGLDEDGLVLDEDGNLPTLLSGSMNTIKVKVTNRSGGRAYLHMWLDLNNNGIFEANEQKRVQVPNNRINHEVSFLWTDILEHDHIYMRLRLTNAAEPTWYANYVFSDDPLTDVDERAIGDGLGSGRISGTSDLTPGEVEDYRLPVRFPVDDPTIMPPCEGDSRLGLMDPVQAYGNAVIVRLEDGGFLSWGYGTGTNRATQAQVENGINGFDFKGTPLMMTGSALESGYEHRYYLLTTTGLYLRGRRQMPLPEGIEPKDIQMIDNGYTNEASSGHVGQALMLLTKIDEKGNGGEIWVQAIQSSNPAPINGNGSVNNTANRWYKVMLEDGVTPLTGMKDVRTTGMSAIATDGNKFYTWGENVFLGDNSQMTDKSYAAEMEVPTGIVLPVKQVEITHHYNTPPNDGIGTSYYLRDNDGNLFAMGANYVGQLGVLAGGSGSDPIRTWRQITQVREGSGTKPIGKVTWISSNSNSSLEGVIFQAVIDGRIYSAGAKYQKSGIVGNNYYLYSLLTPATQNNGEVWEDANIKYVESGLNFSIAIKENNGEPEDTYGFVGVPTHGGTDGCANCTFNAHRATNGPVEYDFINTPKIGVVCGNTPSVPDYPYDFGDVPASYEQNRDGNPVPARHEISDDLMIGETVDGEATAQSVAPGEDNNGTNGDGEDEDGLTNPPVVYSGSQYAIDVKVKNTSSNQARLHGWIDFDGDGKFSLGEYTSTIVPANAGEDYVVNITWPMVVAKDKDGQDLDKVYMRLRLTDATGTQFYDRETTEEVDERAIGDGRAAGTYGTTTLGEVEDYQLEVIHTSGNAAIPDCDDELGMMNPVQAFGHSAIVRLENKDFMVFGQYALPEGGGLMDKLLLLPKWRQEQQTDITSTEPR